MPRDILAQMPCVLDEGLDSHGTGFIPHFTCCDQNQTPDGKKITSSRPGSALAYARRTGASMQDETISPKSQDRGEGKKVKTAGTRSSNPQHGETQETLMHKYGSFLPSRVPACPAAPHHSRVCHPQRLNSHSLVGIQIN